MTFSCRNCFCKFGLWIFNSIIFLVGSAILALGIWLAADKDSFIGLSTVVPSDQMKNFINAAVIEKVSYILIAIGGLMFLVGLLGYCGILWKSRPMLIAYGVILLIILILEITAGSLAIVYKGKAADETKNLLNRTLSKYNSKSEDGQTMTKAWDILQAKLHCCGINNYTDYKRVAGWAKEQKIVPGSCCILDEATLMPISLTCFITPNNDNSYYMKGCYKEVRDFMMIIINMIIAVLISFGVVQLLGVIFAFCLATSIDSYR